MTATIEYAGQPQPNRLRNLMNMVANTPPPRPTTTQLLPALVVLLMTLAPWSTAILAQGDTAAGQQAVIEIVRLQHRDPSQIRAAISPYMDERGAINQIDNNLIISTSRANLAQLEALIAELDIPRRQLRISVNFRYGLPPLPQVVDDATITASPSTESVEESVQTIIITEGEYAHFSAASGEPLGGLSYPEIVALLEQQRTRATASISLMAQPRESGALVEIAELHSETDSNGAPQPRIVNSTLDVDLNQWQIVTLSESNRSSDNLLTAVVPPSSTAIRVEVLH